MAQTTQRIIELVIKLQGAKSLEELEQVTEEINNELKEVGENSEAFKELGKLANDAVKQVKKVDDELSQVTAQEKTEAIRKVGEGLVGAFQVAAGASLFFGKKTSEELEKVIAKVGGLFNIVDGLDKVSKVFAANNIKALKATVKGFQESAVAAKLFGTTTKAAIAATGLGLIIVILASIIANFDKLKVAIKNAFGAIKEAFPFLEKIQDFVDDIKERFGSLGNIIKGVGAAIASIFTKQTMKEAFTEAVEEAKELNELQKEYQKLKEEDADILQFELELMRERGDTLDKQIAKQKKYNDDIIANLEKQKALGLEIDEAELEGAKRNNQLLDLRLKNYEKQLQEEAKVIQARNKAELEAAKVKTDAAIKAAKELKIQNDFLEEQREILGDIGKYADYIFQNNLQIANIQNALNDGTKEQLISLKERGALELNENTLATAREEIERLTIANSEKLLEYKQQLIAIGEEENQGLITAAEATKRRGEVTIALNQYTEELKENAKGVTDNLSLETQARLKLLDLIKTQYVLEQTEIANKRKSLDNEWNQFAQLNKEEINAIIEKTNRTEEENNKLLAYENERKRFQNEQDELSNQYRLNLTKQYEIQLQINNAIAEGVDATTESVNVTETLLQKYNNWYDNFFSKYGELIQGINDLTMAAFDLAIVNAEKEAEAEIERLEKKAEAEIEIEEGIIDEKKKLQEDYADSLNELNDLLADAEGERYEDILAQIEIEKQAKQQAIDDEIAAENAKAAIEAQLLIDKQNAEKKANQLKKTQAIVQAVIDTALSILSALKSGFPLGLIMAGVYGAMGAVQIATISKQPVYAEGGYTGDGDKYQPAGIVHKGEYVVPQRVVRNPQATAMLETLEGMRLRGYAEGGAVTAIPNIPDTENMLDYARIGNEVARALKENPMFVSWTEWRDTDAKARWVLNRAGLGRV